MGANRAVFKRSGGGRGDSKGGEDKSEDFEVGQRRALKREIQEAAALASPSGSPVVGDPAK